MLLRTRVTLIVGLALLILGGGLVFAGHQRERLADARFADATLTGQETFWHKVVENVAQRLESEAIRVAAEPRLAQAVAINDAVLAATLLTRATPKTLAHDTDIRAAATARNGHQLASTLDPLAGAVLDGGALTAIIESGQPVLGIHVAEDRSIWIAASVPVRAGRDVVGAVTLAVGLDEVVREFKASTGADLLVVNRAGALATGTNQIFWPRIQQEVVLGKRRLFVFDDGERIHAVGSIRLYDGLTRYAGTLISIRDITESHTREHEIGMVSVVTATVFLGLIVLGFYLYLQKAFDPLREAILVIEAMSRGDTSVAIRHRSADDEIGRIAAAIAVFREQVIEQEMTDTRRRRQRRWQERFIRNQLAELCSTLDEPARQRALDRLAAPADDAEAPPPPSPDETTRSHALGALPLALAAIVDEVASSRRGGRAAETPSGP